MRIHRILEILPPPLTASRWGPGSSKNSEIRGANLSAIGCIHRMLYMYSEDMIMEALRRRRTPR